MKLARLLIPLGLCTLIVSSARSATITHLEDDLGPFSGSSFGPTDLGIFDVNRHVVDGGLNDGTGPNDVFTFEIGLDDQLVGISVLSFTDASDPPVTIFDRMFFGIHNDVIFPVDEGDMLTGNAVGNEFLGGLVLGDVQNVNLLPLIGNNNFGIGTGFIGPLGEGSYTVYMQQTGGQNTQYEIAFDVASAVTVPEPSAYVALSVLAIGVIGYRRKRKAAKRDTL